MYRSSAGNPNQKVFGRFVLAGSLDYWHTLLYQYNKHVQSIVQYLRPEIKHSHNKDKVFITEGFTIVGYH